METKLDDRRTAEIRVHAPFGTHMVSLDLAGGSNPPALAATEEETKDGKPPVQPGISYSGSEALIIPSRLRYQKVTFVCFPAVTRLAITRWNARAPI